MPFAIFKLIPIINTMDRNQVFLFDAFKISAFVLAGFSIGWLFSEIRRKKLFNLVIITFIILLIVHLGIIGHKRFQKKYEFTYPEIYDEIKKDSPEYTLINILYLPRESREHPPMLMQTIHNKKIFYGQISRVPKYNLDKALQIIDLIDEPKNNETMIKIQRFAQKYNIKYWILNKRTFHKKQGDIPVPEDLLQSRKKRLIELFNEPIYEDKEIIVFINNNFLQRAVYKKFITVYSN